MTIRCFVAGSPISHSRSPLIHGHWIAERGLDALYERIEVTPERLPWLMEQVRSGVYRGGNLTVPLKHAVLPLIDELTADARAMGAVNTVFMRDGRLMGANTDVPGFFRHLDQSAPAWDERRPSVLLLGAGGAARAIVAGLLRRPIAQLTIANRSQERTAALLADLGPAAPAGLGLSIGSWPPSLEEMAEAGLVINATSLGMKGQPPLELQWPERMDGSIVNDIVYAPLETDFLREGVARGAHPVDGLGMLLHQAALAFGFWFDETPAVSPALRALVEADLAPPSGPSRP